MKTALVFATHGSLDFFEVRTAVLRIPEVLITLKEAQKSIDVICPKPIDLITFLHTDDSRFWANEKFRKLTTGLVQIGLASRFLKRYPHIDAIVAGDTRSSVAQVMAGKQSLREYVESSLFQPENNPTVLELATGVMPQNLCSYVYNSEEFQKIDLVDQDIQKVVAHLRDEHDFIRFINVGPCNTLINTTMEEIVYYDVQVEETINLDPMLTWFWPSINSVFREVAN